MFSFFKRKIIFFIVFIIVIIFGFVLSSNSFKGDVEFVKAGLADNVSGFAWNSGIGWISFNSTDCDIDGDGVYEGAGESGGPAPVGCPESGTVINYGVDIDVDDGNVTGYAWSPNLGWISFNRKTCNGGSRVGLYCKINNDCPGGNQCRDNAPGVTGNPPADPYLTSTTVIANYDIATEKVTGWAKILSLGDDGWISFNLEGGAGVSFPISLPADFPIDLTPPSFSVSISSTTGEFSGWAWNGNDDDTGVGWISFNCSNEDSCATVDYKVIAAIGNTAPVAQNLTAPNWNYTQACANYAKQAFLRWEFSDPDESSAQSAYQVIIDDDSNPVSPIYDTGKTLGTASQFSATSTLLAYNEAYYWWLKLWDDHDLPSVLTQYNSASDTDNDDGNNLTFTTYGHEFPDVNFDWFPGTISKGEEIEFYSDCGRSPSKCSKIYLSGAPSTAVACDDSKCEWLWSASPGASIDSPTASTTVITFSSSGAQTVTLKVTNKDGTGYYCSRQENISAKSSLPTWQEVKPE